MGEIHENITAKDLCESMGEKPDTFRMRLNTLRENGSPLFADVRWSLSLNLSPEQAAALCAVPNKNKKVKPRPPEKSGGEQVEDSLKPLPNVAGVTDYPANKWPLWAAFAITACASVPNMVEVTTAIKGSSTVAYALTAAFTIVPFLLVYSKAKGRFVIGVVISIMAYTAFCNAASIFGGLTALDSGYIVQPTVFLEAVTNMLNTPYISTARALSGCMALIIGCIEYVAFKGIAK